MTYDVYDNFLSIIHIIHISPEICCHHPIPSLHRLEDWMFCGPGTHWEIPRNDVRIKPQVCTDSSADFLVCEIYGKIMRGTLLFIPWDKRRHRKTSKKRLFRRFLKLPSTGFKGSQISQVSAACPAAAEPPGRTIGSKEWKYLQVTTFAVRGTVERSYGKWPIYKSCMISLLKMVISHGYVK
jgi:hypothetical protein